VNGKDVDPRSGARHARSSGLCGVGFILGI